MIKISFKKFLSFCMFIFIAASFYSSCKKEKIITDGFKLNFSHDSVKFDTIFSQFGGAGKPASAYQYFLVYNNNSSKVKTRVRLGGGASSQFRMNIDGFKGTDHTFEIAAGDSLWVFIEAYVDQQNKNNPFIVTDSIMFDNGSAQQKIPIIAWGQDAHYIHDTIISSNATWINDKPYVLYNFVGIQNGVTLKINKGVKIYSHNTMQLFVGGTLDVEGDINDKVIFQGDRLDYNNDTTKYFYPNQWRGLRFLPGSSNNKIKNAIIKNAVIGIEVDSVNTGSQYNLYMENVEVRNMGYAGIVGVSATIHAVNTLVANCGAFTFAGIYGGDYTLTNCTFVSYNTIFKRNAEHFGFNNAEYVDNNKIPIISFPLNYNITNCIVDGSLDDEIIIDSSGPKLVSGKIKYSVLKTKKMENKFSVNNNILNTDLQFLNIEKYDFTLNNSSPAKNKGTPLGILFKNFDLLGKARNLTTPSIGCYE